jgi:hypothetical protein
VYVAGFELEAFEEIPVDQRCALVLALCDALTAVNRAYLRHKGFGKTVPLYASHVRYQDQILGADKWKDIPRLLETGRGACEDLASWRVAELHVTGERTAFVDVDTYPLPDGRIVYHVVVIRPMLGGLREDPSAMLGMKTPV